MADITKAAAFRALHDTGVLVLPNAWDAGSAALIAQVGAPAIATTSGGVAWSLGRTDGHGLRRDEMIEQVRRIAAAVGVPVTADVEGGYGPGPDDVAATVAAAAAAGAVGINLEDSQAPGGPLFDVAAQVERVQAARAAVPAAELLINVRTDVFLFGIGDPDGRLDDVLTRGAAYAAAGADCLFVPGLVDLDVVAELVKGTDLPINTMAGPGAPTVAEFAAAGVRRVSVGTALVQAAYSVAQRAAKELLTSGTYTELSGALDFGAINATFAR